MELFQSVRSVVREPGYRRNVAIRRTVAAALMAAAGINALQQRGADPLVVTFAEPVSAGEVVGAGQLQLTRMPGGKIPDNALRDIDAAADQILAAPASRGEVVTSTRLVGPDLARGLVAGEPPESYSMVPVALAEPDIIPMLRHGATVNVVSVTPDGGQPATIAAGGRVVLAGAEEGTVMLLLPNADAAAVAAASLTSPLTVVLSGPAAG